MKIYISSRRTDAPAFTGRISDYLVTRVGRENVVTDVATIEPGRDFNQTLEALIRQCSAMLVIIGPKWLGSDRAQTGQVSPWIAREVETALRLNLRVIPVLVDGAAFLRMDQLPPSLQPLFYLNAARVRPDPDFMRDMAQIATAIGISETPATQSIWDRLFGRRSTRPSTPAYPATHSPEFSLPSWAPDPYATPDIQAGAESEDTFEDDDVEVEGNAAPEASAESEVATSVDTAPTRIFISYKSEDRPAVSALASALSETGFEVWYDGQLDGGHLWWDDILHHIRTFDLFLFMLTPASVDSVPCQREFGYAAQLNKRIMPLRLADEVNPQLLPSALQKIQIVDFRKPEESGFANLKRALGALPEEIPPPYPLPAPPDAPISPLGVIKEQLGSAEIAREQQADIVLQLKAMLKRPETSGGARLLLRQLSEHDDCRGIIRNEIQEILG